MRGSLAVAAVLASGFVLTPSADADPAVWEVTELRGMAPGNHVRVDDINDHGVAVGEDTEARVAVKWDATGEPTVLEVPEGCFAWASSISNTGWIAGVGFCPEDDLRFTSMRWNPQGEATFDDRLIVEDAIDDNGIVAGTRISSNLISDLVSPIQDDDFNAYVYLAGHELIDLPEAGADRSVAFDLTSWGYVVGALSGVPGLPQSDIAVGWYGDQVFPLLRTTLSSAAVAVNEHGVALVGAYDLESPNSSSFLVAPGGRVVALDAAGTSDHGTALNDAGIVVGTRDNSDGRFYVGSQSISLSDIVSDEDAEEFDLTYPHAVNDDAWVVGETGDGRAWLLTPPAS